MCYVYWIRYPEHVDPYIEGYIGVTVNPKTRFCAHSNSSNRKVKDAIATTGYMEILFEGSVAECYSFERLYRPTDKIGWNKSVGGKEPREHLYDYKIGDKLEMGVILADRARHRSKKNKGSF